MPRRLRPRRFRRSAPLARHEPLELAIGIASNIAAKLDDCSDLEDIEAMETKKAVAIAVVGVTVRGSDPAAMQANAEQIARELSTAIVAAGQPLR